MGQVKPPRAAVLKGPIDQVDGVFRLDATSDAVVRFGPVQRTFCLNLEPDLWFGSSGLLNLGLDLEGLVQQVRFG